MLAAMYKIHGKSKSSRAVNGQMDKKYSVSSLEREDTVEEKEA